MGTDTPKVEAVEKSNQKFKQSYRKSGCCSRFYFSYCWTLIDSMNKNDGKMTEEMIEDMSLDDGETKLLVEKLFSNLAYYEEDLNKRAEANESKGGPPLPADSYYKAVVKAVARTFVRDIFVANLFCIAGELCAIGFTTSLIYLIAYIKDDDAPIEEGIVYLVIFSVLMYLSAMCKNHYIFKGALIAVQMRKTLVAAMYQKISKLSMKSLTQTNSGKLITIISGDIQAIERPLGLLAILFASPVINLMAYSVLWITSGWIASLITLAIWIIIMVAQQYSSGLKKKIKLKESVHNDTRQKLVNDIINGSRTIKSYGWENHYLDKIYESRINQKKFIFQQAIIDFLGFTVFSNGGLFACILIFVTQWAMGKELNSGNSMATLAMLFYIFLSVNSLTYMAMTTLQTFLAVLFRISSVLEMSEYDFSRDTEVQKQDVEVSFENADISWGFKIAQKAAEPTDKKMTVKEDSSDKKKQEDESLEKQLNSSSKFKGIKRKVTQGDVHRTKIDIVTEPNLYDLNFKMKSGDFMVVVGQVGCGKTSLLYSIMEEMETLRGKTFVNGSIAYVEQEPFIYSETVKENIMFGKPFDQKRLDDAIQYSCLTSDIKIFNKGLDTVIGERGTNVSGGQKARISLARAIYSNADIILLDDPLSAVDPEVANNIFTDCIRGYLKDKVVILVTHQLQFLERCEKIMLLKEGRVEKLGSFEDITAAGFNIKDILDSFNQANKDNEDKDEKNKFQAESASPSKIVEKKDQSPKKTDEIKQDEPEKGKEKKEFDMVVEDFKHEGGITFQDYVDLFSFSIGKCGIFLYWFMSILCALLQLLPSYILATWTALPFEEQQSETKYIWGFVASTMLYMVLSFARSYMMQAMMLTSTTNIHNNMIEKVMRSPILFFDSNPSGRISTRFTKDLTIMDLMFSGIVVFTTQSALRIISVAITVSFIQPLLFVVALIASVYIRWCYQTGVGPMIQAQRFDMQFYGPINSLLGTTVNGLVTVRSYRKFDHFEYLFMDALEKSANSTFCFNLANRWVGARLDTLVVFFGVATCAFSVLLKNQEVYPVPKEMLVISIQIVTDIIVFFSITIRMYAEIQNMMTCSQRIVDYTRLESEDDLQKPGDQKHLEANWPSKGEMCFDKVSMKYRPQMDPSMIDVSMNIQPGMKVGIVGRTGAGKSTILQVLFRLTDSCEGSIKIDGVDIKDIGLHLLRKNVAYIPQAPFLIQGSIRENLDPFGDYSDEQVNHTLEEINLFDHIKKNCENGLQTEITESNNVFSMGQKQLLCLGRALIRKTKILVLDEATANVDLQTDNFIQEKLKTAFKNCSMIVIAHRLATVIDADRILVMDKGEAVEYDHPFKLLAEDEGDEGITKKGEDGEDGFFAKMVKATGEETSNSLFQIAKEKFRQQQ